MILTPKKIIVCSLLAVFYGQAMAEETQTNNGTQSLMLKLDQQQLELDALRNEVDNLKTSQKKGAEVATTEHVANKSTKPAPNDMKIMFSGRVHRMLQYVDDGKSTDFYHTDSDQAPTILKVNAEQPIKADFKLGATIEIGLQQNRPVLVNQDNREPKFEVSSRITEVYADSDQYGKFSFGRGYMSSWYVAETDLSGTQFASLLSPGMLFGGLKFVDSKSGQYSKTKVSDYFFDMERFLLKDRVRYDSIQYLGHTTVSSSVTADDGWDVTLRTIHKPGNFIVTAATSFQKDPFLDIDARWDAVISSRHEPTGLNFTMGGFISDTPDSRDPGSYVLKLGWLTKFMPESSTAFSLDWSKSHDVGVVGDDADSWGMFVVQSWDAYNLKVHAGIRQYKINVPGKNMEPITVIPVGVSMFF